MMSIVADSALAAWATAVREISRKSDREVVHSIVSFPCDTTLGPEHEQVSQMLTDAGAWDVKQVADTIFPQSLYRPEAEEPAKALFENWNYARQVKSGMPHVMLHGPAAERAE